MWDSITKARNLKDIETKEVSLVDKAANKKRFLFFKSSEEGDCLDLLAILENIDEHYTLSDAEEVHIEKVLKTLAVLEAEDVESLSNVILLLSKLIATEPESTPVSKQITDNWPSLSSLLSISKAAAGVGVVAEDNDSKWPSLSCVVEEDE